MTEAAVEPNGAAEPEPVDAVKKEPKAKKAKAPKPPKEKDPNAVSRPRLPKYPDTDLITVLKPGSKARGAAVRFNFYVTGMTVKEYVDKMAEPEQQKRKVGQTQADMRWDMGHGFIHIGPEVVPIPPPEPAPVKAAKAPKTAPEATPESAPAPAAE